MLVAKDFSHLLGLSGFSDNLLKNHFTLYEGYVKNTNALKERMTSLEKENKTGPGEYMEIKRRFGWEWNGVRLHELYFGNLSKEAVEFSENSQIGQKITAQFGSFADFKQAFLAAGALRGIGWVILYEDPENGELTNTWINEHDGGHLAGARPLLVLDVFEHAFMLDYGLKRVDYLEAFFKAIDWSTVEKRLG